LCCPPPPGNICEPPVPTTTTTPPPSMGACCLESSCYISLSNDCGGIFKGANSTCATNPCELCSFEFQDAPCPVGEICCVYDQNFSWGCSLEEDCVNRLN
jgi:hypothetical protein